MDERLKFRLTGAVLLMALAAILLPMAFDGAGVADLPRPHAVPPAPAVDLAPMDTANADWDFIAERDKLAGGDFGGVPAASLGQPTLSLDADPGDQDPAGEPDPAAAAAAGTPADDAHPLPSLGADGLPRTWAVQLASFADADNARTLRDRLQAAGYPAFLTASGSTAAKPLTRVAVGPSISRQDAKSLRDQLAKEFALDGLVVRYSL